MPRILVDLLFLTGRKGGMESYVKRLYSAMPRDTGIEFVGLISREAEGLDLSWFPGELVRSGVSGDDRVAWALGELRGVPSWARRTGADLIHLTANLGPLRASVPVVMTLHDLLPFVHPEWVPGAHAPILRWMIKRAARNAARILTISEASRADIVRELGVAGDRVEVIPLAGGDPAPVTQEADVDPRVVLTIGNRLPHKNGETLIRALAHIPVGQRPRLVITGETGADDPLLAVARDAGVVDDVDFAGWVSPAELDELFGRASVVAVPSLFEGFGLPVLEGMSRGRAVVCSDLPVLHETAGDAASYVAPTDPEAWAAELARLLADPPAREGLVAAGTARAAAFSWQSTAERTLAVFQRVLADS
ncbi:glycosyltransferase family 4 protein [Leifsonia aquatica]|uniref:glycosyltransferase family 4 protein n=1 Tax=Leifsonia aquatica TaxID=144185 RepID=UPI003809A763